jgi:hypothetical protein
VVGTLLGLTVLGLAGYYAYDRFYSPRYGRRGRRNDPALNSGGVGSGAYPTYVGYSGDGGRGGGYDVEMTSR